MDLIGIVMGWNWKVQRTRRRWDRLREHALEKKGDLRKRLLRELDLLEDNLKTLEEQKLSRRDGTRILREVEMELANISDLLENGEAWLIKQGPYPRQKKRDQGSQPEGSEPSGK
jgi:hypothetical protein